MLSLNFMKKLNLRKVGQCFALIALIITGCVTGDKLATGGAYAGTETSQSIPELFVLDASFDVAYSALDLTFKYERDNRALLWKVSPDIKHSLDKLRIEASVINRDYAIARKSYLSNPTPDGLDNIQLVLGKLQAANAAALAVIQTKGVQ